jgi:hypothetical protein
MSSDNAVWDHWLDGLADAAEGLERQLAANDVLDFPDLAPPPLDSESDGLPAELLPRARELLDRLDRLERIAQTQRDKVASELRRVAVPRPRPAALRGYEVGATLDVAG